jgi:two-component system chemotaxis response regulator CheB
LNPKLQTRDIVVIGASAGGLDAASSVIRGLPQDFPAAVFVVLHMAAGFSSRLPELRGTCIFTGESRG